MLGFLTSVFKVRSIQKPKRSWFRLLKSILKKDIKYWINNYNIKLIYWRNKSTWNKNNLRDIVMLSLSLLLTGLLAVHVYGLFCCTWADVKSSIVFFSFWMILPSTYQDTVRSVRFPMSQESIDITWNVRLGLGAFAVTETCGYFLLLELL